MDRDGQNRKVIVPALVNLVEEARKPTFVPVRRDVIDPSKVQVGFRDGVARLRGEVPSEYLRSAAEELARWTPSVIETVNELRVARCSGHAAEADLPRDGFSLPPRR